MAVRVCRLRFSRGCSRCASQEPAFLRDWSAASRELFNRRVEEQSARHQHFPLWELRDKLKRHTALINMHNTDPIVTPEGVLSIGAKLHATLVALQVCEAEAKQRDAEAEAEVAARSSAWLAVRAPLMPPRRRAGSLRESSARGASRKAGRGVAAKVDPLGPAARGPALPPRCVALCVPDTRFPALQLARRHQQETLHFRAAPVPKAASAFSKRVTEPPAAENEVKEEEPAAAAPAGKRARHDDDAAVAIVSAAAATAAAAAAAEKAATAAHASAAAASAAAASAAAAARHAQDALDAFLRSR
jgi:hypothetical protein